MNVPKLKGVLAEKGLTQDYVARILGISPSTFYRKIQRGGDSFTVGEANTMVRKIPLTDEEAVEIFLPRKSHYCDS